MSSRIRRLQITRYDDAGVFVKVGSVEVEAAVREISDFLFAQGEDSGGGELAASISEPASSFGPEETLWLAVIVQAFDDLHSSSSAAIRLDAETFLHSDVFEYLCGMLGIDLRKIREYESWLRRFQPGENYLMEDGRTFRRKSDIEKLLGINAYECSCLLRAWPDRYRDLPTVRVIRPRFTFNLAFGHKPIARVVESGVAGLTTPDSFPGGKAAGAAELQSPLGEHAHRDPSAQQQDQQC